MSNEDLVEQIQQGHDELLPVLWDQVSKFVERKAKQYYQKVNGYSFPDLEDIKQGGALGFMTAVYRYQPDQGAKFTTYLAWYLINPFEDAAGFKRGSVELSNLAISLSTPINDTDSDDLTLEDTIVDECDHFLNTEDELFIKQLRAASLANGLDNDSLNIFMDRYLDGEDLETIAAERGITLKKLKDILSKTMRHFRKYARYYGLEY